MTRPSQEGEPKGFGKNKLLSSLGPAYVFEDGARYSRSAEREAAICLWGPRRRLQVQNALLTPCEGKGFSLNSHSSCVSASLWGMGHWCFSHWFGDGLGDLVTAGSI